MSEPTRAQTVTIPVRPGRFAYVRVARDGETHDLHVDSGSKERGSFATAVSDGDQVIEIALGSTSDPDLDRARGQLWPPEEESQ